MSALDCKFTRGGKMPFPLFAQSVSTQTTTTDFLKKKIRVTVRSFLSEKFSSRLFIQQWSPWRGSADYKEKLNHLRIILMDFLGEEPHWKWKYSKMQHLNILYWITFPLYLAFTIKQKKCIGLIKFLLGIATRFLFLGKSFVLQKTQKGCFFYIFQVLDPH